jgi:hypothetical protein
MNLPELDRLVRAGWTLRVAAASELYAHPFSAYLDSPPDMDQGHAAVGSNLELALLQLEHYVSQQRPAPETRVCHCGPSETCSVCAGLKAQSSSNR